jgi:hypothetical protein
MFPENSITYKETLKKPDEFLNPKDGCRLEMKEG